MPSIHPTALVSDAASLAGDVAVGPFSIIDGPAVIEAGTKIGAHVWIHGRVEAGPRNTIGYGSIIGADPQDLSFDPAIDSGVRLGPSNVLREYVTIHRATAPGNSTLIGEDNYLMTGVHLGHDVVLGNRNILANNALVAGFVTIGEAVFLSGGTLLHQFIRVGDYAMFQGLAGSSKDVPPYCIVRHGNTLSGLNVIGLRRAGFAAADRNEIKSAYALLFQSGLTTSDALAEADRRRWSPAAAKLIAAVRHPTKRGVLTRIG